MPATPGRSTRSEAEVFRRAGGGPSRRARRTRAGRLSDDARLSRGCRAGWRGGGSTRVSPVPGCRARSARLDRRDCFHERRLPRELRTSAPVQPRRRAAVRPRSRLPAAAVPRRRRHRRPARDPHLPEPPNRPPPAPTPLAARPPRARPARARTRRHPGRLPDHPAREQAPRLHRHPNRRSQSRPPHPRHRRRPSARSSDPLPAPSSSG